MGRAFLAARIPDSRDMPALPFAGAPSFFSKSSHASGGAGEEQETERDWVFGDRFILTGAPPPPPCPASAIIASITLPGIKRNSAKTIMVTRNRTGILSNKRLIRYAPILDPIPFLTVCSITVPQYGMPERHSMLPEGCADLPPWHVVQRIGADVYRP